MGFVVGLFFWVIENKKVLYYEGGCRVNFPCYAIMEVKVSGHDKPCAVLVNSSNDTNLSLVKHCGFSTFFEFRLLSGCICRI